MANLPWLGLIFGALVGWQASAQVPIGAAAPVDNAAANRVTVPFVSVRAIEQAKNTLRYYTEARGEASAGECAVDLDARKRTQVIGLQQRTLDEVLDRLAEADGSAVVYVHGYNVTFEEACRDAALLQKRVGLEGRLLLFTWPANSKVSNYLRDLGDLEWTVLPLQNLLLDLVNRFGSQHVDVIGHSMGAKAVLDAASALGEARDSVDTLGRLILIAPDVDSDIFRRDFANFGDLASAVTVYVSAEDRALKASRRISGEPRLGEGGLELTGLAGIDVVDVVQRRWTWKTGHTYHLNNDAVAHDLRETLSGAPRTVGSRMIIGR
jgi:esterase/lipase superfamily enzyme